jgi:hypothetical protein
MRLSQPVVGLEKSKEKIQVDTFPWDNNHDDARNFSQI